MKSRRHALSLAAILAATVVTGGAAILGMAHAPSHVQAAAAVTAATAAQPVPAAPQHWEEGD